MIGHVSNASPPAEPSPAEPSPAEPLRDGPLREGPRREGPAPGAPSAHDLAELLRRLSHANRGAQRAMATRLGLGLTDLQALEELMLTGPVGPGDLGAALDMRPTAVVALLDRLERSGHARREPHSSDRRRLVIRPTDKVDADGREAVMPLVALLEQAADNLDEEQRLTVAGYLSLVIEAFQAYSAPQIGGADPSDPLP